ncbi:MAG: ATP-dependent sacrificial sulfur transferase LarE [Armatimonadota bacterium]
MDIVNQTALQSKYERLQALIKGLGSAAVAFSGGVDSTLLLKVAHDVLGERCVAVVAVSESYTPEEADASRQLAELIGVECVFVQTSELEDERFASNPANRCYYCKRELFAKMSAVAAERGIRWLLYGANYDDRGDFRPGSIAAAEANARAPLQEVELTKAEIRELSRRLGLPTWSRPASACLASRVPYGTRITAEVLNRIASAERVLKQLGFSQLRVRHHDQIARIEVPMDEFPKIISEETRALVVDRLKQLGYVYVTLDLQGFRSGSMNEVLGRMPAPSGAGDQQ